MVIKLSNYKVTSNARGWVLQRKSGAQWKRPEYYESLDSLIIALVHKLVDDRSEAIVVQSDSDGEAMDVLRMLSAEMKGLKDEILGILA